MKTTINFAEFMPQGTIISDIETAHQQNIQALVLKVNSVLAHWFGPIVVTSGYRSPEDNNRIYSELNVKRAAKGLPPLKVATKSNHLIGHAVDIADLTGQLYFELHNEPAMIAAMDKAGLYGELDTHGWVHLQDVAPKSGRRWFAP